MDNSPFGFEKPQDSPGFLLWQTAIVWQRAIKQVLDKHQLSHAQFVIMALLSWFEIQHESVNQCKIVAWSKLDKMTVSQALKKLSAEGFVKRQTSEKDSRAKTITLTPNGRLLINRIVPHIEATDAMFFATLNHSEQQHCMALLNKLILAVRNDERI